MRPEVWSALRTAMRGNRDVTASPESFVEILEQEGYTVMPLDFRQSADLWGTATITRLSDGRYALVDPRMVRIDRG